LVQVHIHVHVYCIFPLHPTLICILSCFKHKYKLCQKHNTRSKPHQNHYPSASSINIYLSRLNINKNLFGK
jgi:hypothetical protein